MPNSNGESSSAHRLHPPFAQPDPGRRTTMQPSPLPPIEQFVDDIPLIDDFLLQPPTVPIAQYDSADGGNVSQWRQALTPQPDTDDEGWAAADWQTYDWGGVASLGARAPEAAEAHAAWTSTDWDSKPRGLRAVLPGSASIAGSEVAEALDEIARRIRSGELSLEQLRGAPPEAAVAAIFAALMRTRG